MLPLVSVIVPIYKVESFLNQCIDSIINQTYNNLEIILVDDGSPDNCGNICDEYAKIDKRIRVIHKKNGGLSSARNAGLDICKGNYVCFIDSDDWIEKNYINTLLSNIVKYNADVAVCGFIYEYHNKSIRHNLIIDKKILNRDEAILNLYNDNYLNMTVAWNKLYKKELFNSLRYEEGIIHEDENIIHEILYNSKNIVLINDCLYHYRVRSNSITQSNFSKKNLDSVYAYEKRLVFFKMKNEKEFYNLTLIRYFRVLLGNLCKIYNSNIDSKIIYFNEIKSKIDNNLDEFKQIKNMKLLDKLLLISYNINPKIGIFFNNIINKLKKIRQLI